MKIDEIILGAGLERRFRGPRKPWTKHIDFHNFGTAFKDAKKKKNRIKSSLLSEGGAMPGVGSIHISEIEPTLSALEKVLGVDLKNNVLGSVGKKTFSGDIDVALDIPSEDVPAFVEKLKSIPAVEDIAKSSVIMTKVKIVGYDPSKTIPGKERTGHVQIDFMPGDRDWMKTYYHSPHEKGIDPEGKYSKYKGVHRNIMIASIAGEYKRNDSNETTEDGRPLESERFMFSPTEGLMRVRRTPVPKKSGDGYTKKNNNELVSGPWKSANDIAKHLGLDSADDLYSFETLYAAIKKNHSSTLAKNIFDNFKTNHTIQKFGIPTELGESKSLTEDRKVGRELQHLEDLVFVDGSKGALEALDTLDRFGQDVSDVSIKWDGTPAVIFGRDASGEFILTDIAGFKAKRYDGKAKSPEALEKMYLGRGKDVDDNRRAFAKSMRDVWPAFEQAVPADFRGFMLGDLLYKQQPQLENNHFVFKPNKVTYSVKKDSNIGTRIAGSTAGVVIHTHTDLEGNATPANAEDLNEGSLFIMPPVYAQKTPSVNVKNTDRIRAIITQNARNIDAP